MSQRVVLLCSLKDPAERAAYGAFVRTDVLPLAGRLPSVERYEVIAVDDVLEGTGQDLPADFLEVIEVTSVADYQRDLDELLQTEEGQRFESRWQAHIGAFTSVRGEAVR